MKQKLLSLLAVVLVCGGLSAQMLDNASKLYYTISNLGSSFAMIVAPPVDGTAYSGDITIPQKVSYWDSGTKVTTDYPVQVIDDSAFFKADITSVTFAQGSQVKSIGSRAFAECTSLKSVAFAADGKLMIIGDSAFAKCTSLTDTIALPEGVTAIRKGGFDGCETVSCVVLPSTLKKLEARALASLINLKSIVSKASTPPTCDATTFEATPIDIPVYVPCGSIGAYKEAEVWSSFTNIQCVPIATTDLAVADGDELRVACEQRRIIVDGAEGQCVCLYSAAGVAIARTSCAASVETLVVPQAGIYIVTVGNRAVKVAVQ
ncbi:MAG: leucine-rich repeat protein [Bacteroidales bacterium]|nr:leucine-rich repeat protein [Bacteroidales bacterium]